MLRWVPGIVAALAAFAVLKVFQVLAGQSLLLDLLVFLACYLIVAGLVERAMVAYGRKD